MKLFLSSVSIAKKNQKDFLSLVGKKVAEARIALIENGADTYPTDHREWVDIARRMIEEIAGYVEVFDLRNYDSTSRLEADLSKFDVIWVSGGNTYYLRWIMRQSGFDQVVRRLCERGVVYGGDSAGAIIAGPTIDYFQPADSPVDAPELILDGLGLTKLVVVPHWDNERFAPIMRDIDRALTDSGFSTVTIADNEAVVIDGSVVNIV